MLKPISNLYKVALQRVMTGEDPDIDVVRASGGQLIAVAHFETDIEAPSLDKCVVQCGAISFTLEEFRRKVVQTKREFFDAIDNR